MNKYTVLLMRPSWVTSEPSTFLGHIDADCVLDAQEAAQREAWESDQWPGEAENYTEDEIFDESRQYKVLLVIEGHHFDKSTY